MMLKIHDDMKQDNKAPVQVFMFCGGVASKENTDNGDRGGSGEEAREWCDY